MDERKLSPAEHTMLELLVELVRDYKQANFPMKKSTPAQMLEFLMEENELKPADLPLPASRVSENPHWQARREQNSGRCPRRILPSVAGAVHLGWSVRQIILRSDRREEAYSL